MHTNNMLRVKASWQINSHHDCVPQKNSSGLLWGTQYFGWSSRLSWI